MTEASDPDDERSTDVSGHGTGSLDHDSHSETIDPSHGGDVAEVL